ncbi:MAG: signal recognition particle-docking protein FtsY, partial [Paracoccaceae bacterium]|nr:signal recognition particle-docking protein FtsY [Paracoccaceae bacterium]
MAFFEKLKNRLFKSSSKLDAGLEAIFDEVRGPVEAPAPEAAAVAYEDAPLLTLPPAQPTTADVEKIEPILEPELDPAKPALQSDQAEISGTVNSAPPEDVVS